ncbi:MAG TPA: hypothetical protein VGJ81_08155 [Thermoanaerobaculia bacterium]
MKRAVVLFGVALLLASCGSGKPAAPAKVHMNIVQLTGIAPSQPPGPFDVQLGVEVQNLTNEPVTVKRVEISEIGAGAYVLRAGANRPYLFNTAIAPGTADTVTFWVHAYAVGVRGSSSESEPVSLRATVFFDAPSGTFHEIQQQVIDEH